MFFRSLFSGSSGNCILVAGEQGRILIDAGVSAKRIEAALSETEITPGDLDALFITHEHSDHIAGVGVLARRYGIPIYATAETINSMLRERGVGRIDEKLINYVSPNKTTEIKDLIIEPFRISHDAANPVSYTVRSGESKFAMATDLGVFDDYTVSMLDGADVLYIEANHDRNMLLVGRYPYYLKQRILGERGHLSNDNTVELLESMKALPNHIILAHLSKENNYPELAYETVKQGLIRITEGKELPELFVARRDEPSEIIHF